MGVGEGFSFWIGKMLAELVWGLTIAGIIGAIILFFFLLSLWNSKKKKVG